MICWQIGHHASHFMFYVVCFFMLLRLKYQANLNHTKKSGFNFWLDYGSQLLYSVTQQDLCCACDNNGVRIAIRTPTLRVCRAIVLLKQDLRCPREYWNVD